uniref:ARAD1B17314p n=1 Tax=Blastobotrys adeninivorans TaxID=409370 RepID=A0A060T760_BLAAD
MLSILIASLATLSQAAHHSHAESGHIANIVARDNTCKFPDNEDLVKVTPDDDNAGWAMSPDQSCKPGSWCPYACPSGMLAAQWDPSVKTYSYPGSQNGGLYCNSNGDLEKPFDDKPYCVNGTGMVSVDNKAKDNVAFCQTVLPGNEAMLIPTNIDGGKSEVIAVPDQDYWASTAAHYYINPPGVSTKDACVWGSSDQAVGNWAPYVAGANTDSDGKTYVKIGWNPVYLENDCPFKDTKPNFGIRVVCDDGDCNGTPCEIDPSKMDVNQVKSADSADGAGDGAFCVVTANKGKKARIEVFGVDSGKDLNPASSKKARRDIAGEVNLANVDANATVSSVVSWKTVTVSTTATASAPCTTLAVAQASGAANGTANGTSNATVSTGLPQVAANGAMATTGSLVAVIAAAALALVM